MSAIEKILNHIQLPRMVRVKQHFNKDAISDIPAAIRTELERQALLGQRIKPGSRVAISAGSRGIANLHVILKTLVEWVRNCGGEPFLFPAMGSHGGATADGQSEVLRNLGVTEESVGAPIHSSMDVVDLGQTPQGWPVRIDRIAFEQADVIIPVGRIKPHTSFTGPYESGLVKMISIGIGKQAGADTCHAGGMVEVSERISSIAKIILDKTPIIFGLGILENAYDETWRFCALPAERILEEEPGLLEQARKLMPQIMIDRCDVLVVDEAGKNIAGTGMDPNVIRSSYLDTVTYKPLAQRIALLDLTDVSHGNANGMNLADTCTRRFFDKVDFAETYPNPLTTGVLQSSKVPLVMDNDRLAIQAAIKGCFNVDHQNARLVRIKNTLKIEEVLVSENLLDQVNRHPDLQILGEAEDFIFDTAGNLF
jgi:hypothetical protein